MKNKRNVIMALVAGCIIVPIIISQILRIPLGGWTIGDENSWVGFFGGYVGGIIGGLVAFFAARYQIDRNFEKQIANEEINRFINQMPSIVKIKYELTKMHISIKDLSETIDNYKNTFEQEEDWVDDPFHMYQLNEVNWNSIDTIDDVDLCTFLVELKHKYIDIFGSMTFDVVKADAIEDRLENESLSSFGFNLEKLQESSVLGRVKNRVREERRVLFHGEELTNLSKSIEEAKVNLELILKAINGKKVERSKIMG